MAAKEGYVVINGMETKVVTIGGWVEDQLPTKHVIICIPGNPGITGYYRQFIATLYSKTGIPVWTLSHGGHELPSHSKEELKNNLHNYNLDGQTKHKIAFIEKFVPKDVKITFVGHSIGCKIILDALKISEISNQLHKSYCLFPTIEHMAVTPNGKFLTGTIKPFIFLIVFASWIFHMFPYFIKKLLINMWFMFEGTSSDCLGVTVKLVKPKVLRNVFYMAYDEMDTVKDLDKDTIDKFGSKLVFYYGFHDNWAPLVYCERLKRDFPNLDIQTCERGFDHAFVLNSGVSVGLMVADWFNTHKVDTN